MNRDDFPNGGWQFHQAQTGWWAEHPTGRTFNQQVESIIKHRSGNPVAVAKFKLTLDPGQVAFELEEFNRIRLGLPDPKRLPPPPQRPSMSGAVQSAVGAVKKMARGVALLFEWEESGLPPVAAGVSASRASVCAVCPNNDKDEWTRFLTGPVSERIRKQLGRLHEMNLSTPSDDQLFACKACICPMRLKVHTPKELILKRLKPEERSELDPSCWITKE